MTTYEYRVEQVRVGGNDAAARVLNEEAQKGWRTVSVWWRPTDAAPHVLFEREVKL